MRKRGALHSVLCVNAVLKQYVIQCSVCKYDALYTTLCINGMLYMLHCVQHAAIYLACYVTFEGKKKLIAFDPDKVSFF